MRGRPRSPWRRRAERALAEERDHKQRRGRGLNENYARELLELHTLGVEGGYTQRDVSEVARCFTGWTIAEMRDDPHYVFRRGLHDPSDKQVLGKAIDAGGERDGEVVLDLLARHPSTARFIARKLARRFVADEASTDHGHGSVALALGGRVAGGKVYGPKLPFLRS